MQQMKLQMHCFLKRNCLFDIEKTIYTTIEAHHNVKDPSLDAILEADQWARQYANGVNKKS